MKKSLSALIIALIIMMSGSVFARDEFIRVGPNEFQINSSLIETNMNFSTKNIKSIPDAKMSHSSPQEFSYYAEDSWVWFRLRDSNHQIVKNIKVSRIEFIQNNKVIARANDVESTSISGQYRCKSLEFINPFENSNGINLVDAVFYLGSKEVVRLQDFEIGIYSEPVISRVYPYEVGIYNSKFSLDTTLMNVDEDSIVEAYLVDEDGTRVTKIDSVYRDYFDSRDYTRRIDFNVSFVDKKYLDVNSLYDYVVTVDGKEITNNDHMTYVTMTDEPRPNITYSTGMPNLYYWISGINLVEHGPYKITIEQNGKITKELDNIEAVFNEKSYEEEIKVDLPAEYFDNYGEMYTVKLYDSNGKQMKSFDFLEPVDDIEEPEIDIVDSFEGFKVFETKVNVEPNKTWRVRFNEAIDQGSIDNGNAYVYNKGTSRAVKVDYSLESNGRVLTMTPSEMDFELGETYVLVIDKRVKSLKGSSLGKPAALEFKIR